MNRKTKFSLSFKEALVKEVISGSIGSIELSRKHGINDRYLRRLVKKYEDHGSLSHQQSNNVYDKSLKIACVLSVIKKAVIFE